MSLATLTSDKSLKVTISSFSDERAYLVFSDNQVININKKFLPEGAKEGDELFVDLLTQDQLNQNKNAVAQEVLREILKEGSEKSKKE